jgi:BASS family bile acid:Na+ symporter
MTWQIFTILGKINKKFSLKTTPVFESLKLLDNLELNFSAEALFILNITIAFIMFGVALQIKAEHFKRVMKNPRSTIIGFVSQFVLLPAVTCAVAILLRKYITSAIGLGMILVAACPGGNISNFISSLAKGNVALSVSLTAIATLSAIILTPLNFKIWGEIFLHFMSKINPDLFPELKIDPISMFVTVFIILGVPLFAGMYVNGKFPITTNKIVKPIKTLSILIFAGMVISAFASNYTHFINHIKYIFIIVLIHNGIALSTGFSFATLLGATRYDRRSITIETGIQNSALALVLLLATGIFPEKGIGGMAFIAAWWGIWHILSGLGIASLWSLKPVSG